MQKRGPGLTAEAPTFSEEAHALEKVEPISESHGVSRFDCGGHESLNDWLKRFALTNERNESAVVHRDGWQLDTIQFPALLLRKHLRGFPRGSQGTQFRLFC
jgi:hypothetical protein